MRYDLKKRMLEIFTSRQDDLEAELKTSILSSDEHYYLAMLYAIADVSPRVRSIVEPWLRGFAASSRGLGGKGSEQLLSLLYPGRAQQYLFPLPVFSDVVRPAVEPGGEAGEKREEKRRLKIF